MGYVRNLREIVGSRPLIIAGASVLVLDEENRLLLQLRKDNHCWGLAGGSLELGETLEDAAKRELKEETGLIANRLEFFEVFSGADFYYQYPHGDEVYNVIAAYICKDFKGVLKPDVTEVQSLQFFHLEQIPQNISPPDHKVINALFKDLHA